MVRNAWKVLKIREQSPFGPKFPVEFIPVFQKDLGWPNGYTPLHFAAGFLPGGNALKRTEVCQLIIDRVMDKNPADKYGGTPLHLAASGGRLQICQLILTNVLDKNPADSGRGRTPLHFAAANGHTEICKLILDNVQEKNPADLTGKTPLDLAKENGHTETCEIFEIALGSD